MTLLASTWLGLAIILCAFAYFAKRRLVGLSLPIAVALAALAIYIPTGTPRFTKPPAGDYTVLGSKIEVNKAIWVLLDDGKGEPRYYRLKYSNEQANALQGAKDASQGGSGVRMKADGEGGAEFDGPAPVTGEPPKTPETPSITLPAG